MLAKKRGYFFILDAALGLFILVIGVFLITSSYVNPPEPAQVSLLSEDLLVLLSNTKIKDLNNPYAGIGGTLWNQSVITDADISLLQELGELYATKQLDIAEKIVKNVSRDVIPLQFNYEVVVNGTIIYPLEQTVEHNVSRNSSEILLTSKKITFGVINKSAGDLWGPYKVEVFVWQK